MPGRILQGLLLAGCLYSLLFLGIADIGFLSADEPRYAAIGREMAESGDWITPRLWGEPWFEKPPLLYWMTASAWTLGLRDEWAARLPLALLSLAFLVFFQRMAAREFGSQVGWTAALMLGTSVAWIGYSTVAVTDVPLSACFAGAVLLASPSRVRISPWAGVLLGFALLAKGLVALALVLPVLWFWRKRWRGLLVPGAIALAVALPWYALCYAANGAAFFDEFIVRHHFSRFVSGELEHVQPWWFYAPVLLLGLAPWTPSLAGLAKFGARDRRADYYLAVAAFGLVFFSASTNKLPGYLLPLIPLLSIAMAAALARTPSLARWTLPIGAALAMLLPAAASILPDALRDGLTHTTPPSFALWLPLMAVAAVATYLLERRWQAGSIAVAVLVAGGIFYAKQTAYPELERSVSARGLWREIAAKKDQVCLGDVNRDTRYGLAFYHGSPLPDCASEPDRVRIDRP